jgi:hypothetical protein
MPGWERSTIAVLISTKRSRQPAENNGYINSFRNILMGTVEPVFREIASFFQILRP